MLKSIHWWQLNGSRYPRLPNLALKYLGIPAIRPPQSHKLIYGSGPPHLKECSQRRVKSLAA
jgi:hypothetical protein